MDGKIIRLAPTFMRLLAINISGFRRFADSTTVRLAETIIALVGPNEAGKSSFLRAVALLNDEKAFEPRDRTRRTDLAPQISGTYELSDEDRSALSNAGAAQSEVVRRCQVIKRGDGKLSVELIGRSRDLQERQSIAGTLAETVDQPMIKSYGSSDDDRKYRAARYTAAIAALRSDKEALGDDLIQQVRQVLGEISSICSPATVPPWLKEHVADLGKRVEALAVTELSWQLRAARVLIDRRPKAVLFDDPARDLKPSYEVGKLVPSTPPALRNLASVAELDLDLFKRAVESGDLTLRSELLERSNTKLRQVFSEAWVHSEVVPQLEHDGAWLHVFIRTQDRRLSRLDERSDGLRWFVALVAFLTSQNLDKQHPILLVDEAETHLSYDAQASLMAVLEQQEITEKVIYSTHSAGCLPSDLGTGIRAIESLEGERSTVHNGFWSKGLGLSPVYLSMGLGPLAFTAARNELIGEGPCECILLPSLIRQATKVGRLSYQVASGASNVHEDQLSDLVSECGRAAFVVDGDDGGDKVRRKLRSAGFADERVASYRQFGGDGLQLEDFVSPNAFCDAVNSELDRWQKAGVRLAESDLVRGSRFASVEEWCIRAGYVPVKKATLCQRLAEFAATGTQIVAVEAVPILTALHHWATDAFAKVPQPVRRRSTRG